MSPLVSILIPAYNAEQWIGDTIRSALEQTWQNKEIIIVDDGSTDKTLEVATRFVSRGVKVVTQSNQGASAARNKAYSLSHGDYIQWLDADDVLAPDKIAKQIAALNSIIGKRKLFSCSWAQFLYRYRRVKLVPSALWCDLSPTEFLLRKIGQNLFMPNCAWLASRELTEAAGPWNTEICVDDDGEYFCRVLLASDGVRFVRDARAYYRVTGSNSRSRIGRSNKKIEDQWQSMQMHIAYLRSLEESDRVRSACVTFLQDWLLHFYPDRLDIARQAEQLARELGGHLRQPRLSWKYSWIKSLLGWSAAKDAQSDLLALKWSIIGFWDKTMFRVENRKRSAPRKSIIFSKAAIDQ